MSESGDKFWERAKSDTKHENEDLFEPIDIKDNSSIVLNRFKIVVGEYYESLKSDLGKTPVFEEFVKSFIKHTNRDVADRIYNALVKGWKANGYREVDFDKAYNNIFKDIKEIAADIVTVAEEMVSNALTTEKEVIESDKESIKEVAEMKAPILELDDKNRPVVNDDMLKSIEEEISTIEGLTIIQENQLTDYVYTLISTIVSRYRSREKLSLEKGKLLKEVKKLFFDTYSSNIENVLKSIKTFESLYEKRPVEQFKNKLISLQKEKELYETIKNNWGELQKRGYEKFIKIKDAKEGKFEETDDIDSQADEDGKNYSKSALEINHKNTVSPMLKQLFDRIKQVDKEGKIVLGVYGTPTFVGFDVIDDVISTLLLTPNAVDSSFELMVERLEEHADTHKWLRQFIDELNEADKSFQNAFVYHYKKHASKVYYLMVDNKEGGSYTAQMFESNAYEKIRVIQEYWKSNFRGNSPLVDYKDGRYIIDKEKAQELLDIYNSWIETEEVENRRGRVHSLPIRKPSEIPNKEILDWLENFGITLEENTLNDFKDGKVEYWDGNMTSKFNFDFMFEITTKTNSIFGQLSAYLERIVKKEDTEFEENRVNHPFNDANNALKILAKVESKYSKFAAPKSFRDGDKLIHGITQPTHATETVRNLLNNEEFRNSLSNKSFNSVSYLLKLITDIESDEAHYDGQGIRDKIDIMDLGNTAIKLYGKKLYGKNSIAKLSEADHEYVRMSAFFDLRQGEVSEQLRYNGKPVGLRIAKMFLPTMPKDRMYLLQVPVIEADNKLSIEGNGQDGVNIEFQKSLEDLLYEQLVEGELNRIIKFNSEIKSTNVAGYDFAATQFHLLPELNNLEVTLENGDKVKAISLMKERPLRYDKKWFEQTFRTEIDKYIYNFLNNEVENKIQDWLRFEFIKGNTEGYFNKTFDMRYFKNLVGSSHEKVYKAAYDFIINDVIINSNYYMTIIGDPAQFYQANKAKKHFVDRDPTMPKDNMTYTKVSQFITGTNTAKRLTFLVAPGHNFADSKDSTYQQVFMNDSTTIATEVEELVEIYYPNDKGKVKKTLEKYYNEEIAEGRKIIAKQLADTYPLIAEYFDIELSDAQEYSTISTHINMLHREGKIHKNYYDKLQNKIARQRKAEREGNPIPKDAFLTPHEKSLVLQTYKNVHIGFKDEQHNDLMRLVYIKSSTKALLPQNTRGLEIDKLRRMLEKLEDESGQHVRASYQTANKLGAVTNAVTPFTPDGKFNEPSENEIREATLLLEDKNLRKQQENPLKGKQSKEDYLSMLTQALKLLFGNNMLQVKDFIFDGKKYTGSQLLKQFSNTFDKYLIHKEKMLNKRLGLDENRKPKDLKVTMKRLERYLQEIANSKNYTLQDIDALTLIKSELEAIDFNQPLWFIQNSNRIEALLNSIISNVFVNIKLPGTSSIISTELGWKVQDNFNGIDESRIVFSPRFEGQLKGHRKNGFSQVFVASRFRYNDGQLIEFIYENGKHNPKYVTKDENGMLRLKEEMFDSELLNFSMFRIPTPNHGFMSQQEFAGFLPPESADIMVYHRNLMPKKGSDMDADVEYHYHLHTYVDEKGNVKVITKDVKSELLKLFDKKGTKFLEDTSTPEGKLITSIFGTDIDFIEEDFEDGSFLDKLSDKLDSKIFENEFVKVFSSVLSNPNREVQKTVNQVLSTKNAEESADIIEQEVSGKKHNKYFSILSSRYQRNLMTASAAAEMGIRVYSLAVTVNAMIQQSSEVIQLQKVKDDTVRPYSITIGDQKSKDGRLGRVDTLADGKLRRSLTEVLTERQNISLDDGLLQVLGRVNINEVTVNVDALLVLLGFDTDTVNGKKVSLPLLFLSQPIIRDYTGMMMNRSSKFKKFDSEAKENIISQLLEKYQTEEYDYNEMSKKLTGQRLFNNLLEENAENVIQNVVLSTFLNLERYANSLTTLQIRLNINKNGLGQSQFDTINKYEYIQEMPDERLISNTTSLIGNFIADDDNLSLREGEELIENGYILIGNQYIKPTTPVGSMLIRSVDSAYNMWSRFFIQYNPEIQNVFNEILAAVGSMNKHVNKQIELKQHILREIKKYLVTSEGMGIYEGDLREIRRKLFIDTKDNTSLAKYIDNLVNTRDSEKIKEFSRVIELLQNNPLISRFQFDLNRQKKLSIIKYDNTKGESLNENAIYQALIILLQANEVLPDYNGESYSTKKLVRDLVAYSVLGDFVQEAIQFTKFIPMAYFNAIGFSEVTRSWDSPEVISRLLGTDPTRKTLSRFSIQYLQHFPQGLSRVKIKNTINRKYYDNKSNSKNLLFLEEFELTGDMEKELIDEELITIFNSSLSKEHRYQIYIRSGNTFKRISKAGTFGLSEYDISEDSITSIINDYYKVSEPVKKIGQAKQDTNDIFN